MAKRRRPEDEPEQVPEQLRRFDRDEWGPGDLVTRFERWWSARKRWKAEHGERWPLTVQGAGGNLLWSRVQYRMRLWATSGGVGPAPDEWHGAAEQAAEAAQLAAEE